MAITSSQLLAKLENINWFYSMSTVLHGIDTTLLVKYIIEDDSYAIMLSDFSTTYFECLIGDVKIEQHNARFNKPKFSYRKILAYLKELLRDLRTNNSLTFEKLQVDCHTNRITIRTSKILQEIKFNWCFYIISTEQDIFMKHFSMPLFRGVIHLYNHSQNSDNVVDSNNCQTFAESNDNNDVIKPNLPDNKLFEYLTDDSLLNQFFRL